MAWRIQWKAVVLAALAIQFSTFATLGRATTIQLFLDTTVPGQFKLRAATKGGTGIHHGIASYSGVQIAGATSIEHMTPYSLFAYGLQGQGPAGFSQARSANGTPNLSASQDLATPTPNLIRGFGLESSSFEAKNITTVAPPNVFTWEAALLLAQGTHDGNVEIDISNCQICLFSTATGRAIVGATVESGLDGGGLPCALVPEPASAALLSSFAIALVAAGHRRR